MMTIDRLLEKLDPASPILQATFGLERESLRVTEAGTLASTPHPSSLGSRSWGGMDKGHMSSSWGMERPATSVMAPSRRRAS